MPMIELTRKEVFEGAITALLDRGIKFQIPRALEIKSKMSAGELISDHDIAYLLALLKDGQHAIPQVDAHPELQALSAQLVELYYEITGEALENERRANGDWAEA
jgi:hypothetical protein